MKLLAVGDIHLGRHPTRLPDCFNAQNLSPKTAWQRLVDCAIKEQVDVIALTGDVVDKENHYFEAYRALSDGIELLADHNIKVIGIAGNHDMDTLPSLAKQMPGFTLLGEDGSWESLTLDEELTFHGYSFPKKSTMQTSPLKDIAFTRGPGLNIGLLHCDRDQTQSAYAPVSSLELQSANLDLWLLGHIHVPDDLSTSHSGYLGCISGMDPGERGERGPWLFTIASGRVHSAVQWLLAPIRWETIELDITDLNAPEEAREHVLRCIQALDSRVQEAMCPPEAVGLRIILSGQTDFGSHVEKLLKQHSESELVCGTSGARYFIERCIVATRPTIPLKQLAEHSTPPGLLAKRLLLLDDPESEATKRMVAQARKRLQNRLEATHWKPLARDIETSEVINYLRQSGTRALEAMLEQTKEPIS